MTIDHEPGTGSISVRCGGIGTARECTQQDISARLARLQNEATAETVIEDGHPAVYHERAALVGGVTTGVRDGSASELRGMYGGMMGASAAGAAMVGGGMEIDGSPFSGLGTIGSA